MVKVAPVKIHKCDNGMWEVYRYRQLWGVASTFLEAKQVADEARAEP